VTKTIDEALFALQGLLRGVKKDSKNPHFKSNYASLEQVTDTIRPHMQELGIYWLQMPGKIVDGSIQVTTRITHAESRENIEFTMEIPLAKRDPQGAGSSLTYAMRYSLMAALGLPPTDDDAETAIDRNNERETPAKQSPPKQKETPKDEEARKLYTSLVNDMRKCTDADSLAFWWKDQECVDLRKKLPETWQANLREEWVTLGKELRAKQEDDRFPGDDIAMNPLNAG
jgi:hypothetical protein